MAAGEINGTSVIMQDINGAIVGQGDFTYTYGGSPIEISNKSYGDHVTYMHGEGANKQHVFSGELTYNTSASFIKIRQDAIDHNLDDYTLTVTGSGGEAGQDWSITGQFMPNGLSETYPRGAKVATTITLSSSGAPTITPAVLAQ